MSNYDQGPAPVSAIVLTLDEEALLPRCLQSLAWAAEVVVVDSGSRDSTLEVARRHGARVVEQPWLGWSGQRNAGAAASTHDWVMFVDADEVVTEELARSVRAVMASGPDPHDGFSVDRRSSWLARLLPNDQRPSMIASFVRLYHRAHSTYDPATSVHERVVVPGRSILLEGTLIQWREESLAQMTARSARYARLEAQQAHDSGRRPSLRRLAALPVLRLVWLLVARRNLLLGTAGVLHALHKSTAEWMRQLELCERAGLGGLPPGSVTAAVAGVNAGPPSATGPGQTRRIWLAVPSLLRLAVQTLRADPGDLRPTLRAHAAWTQGWLAPGKTWAQRHVPPHPHPPGHAPRVLP